MTARRIVISAPHKSSGKTTVSAGLCAGFRARGLTVQPYKKGPDYIDPTWLTAASGRVCRNLDFFTQSRAEMRAAFDRWRGGAELALVEGNMGLHDGQDRDGADSTAALADLLDAPVVLVLDGAGMGRAIVPILLGQRAMAGGERVAGVILNRVAAGRHESRLRAAIEYHTDLPVLGAVGRNRGLEIGERHLGLVPAREQGAAQLLIERIGCAIADQVDLDRVWSLCAEGPPVAARPAAVAGRRGRIAYASDAAFGFYYPEDLEAFADQGFTPVPFDALHDRALPDNIDALFIGGGFPETQMVALEENTTLRHAIRAAVIGGLPTYAECGGLMYLSRGITWRGERREMVGALPCDIVVHPRPQGRGYVRVRETRYFPWPALGASVGAEVAAHEFHHAGVVNLDPACRFAYEVTRGFGIDGRRDGLVVQNCLAAFTHLRATAACGWPARFAAFIDACRAGGGAVHAA